MIFDARCLLNEVTRQGEGLCLGLFVLERRGEIARGKMERKAIKLHNVEVAPGHFRVLAEHVGPEEGAGAPIVVVREAGDGGSVAGTGGGGPGATAKGADLCLRGGGRRVRYV